MDMTDKNMSSMNMDMIITMIVIMIISGFLSIMSFWAANLSDVRVSLNDVYMVSLMVSWMLLFMGIYGMVYFIIGMIGVTITLYLIRNQSFITEGQYIRGMIPHHSMAIHMSQKLLLRKGVREETRQLAREIIKTQEEEILQLKKLESS